MAAPASGSSAAGATSALKYPLYAGRPSSGEISIKKPRRQIERVGEQRNADGDTRVLVRSPDLQPGDRIVITQLPNAMDGLRVNVAER